MTPHQLVKGIEHLVLRELHPEHSTKNRSQLLVSKLTYFFLFFLFLFLLFFFFNFFLFFFYFSFSFFSVGAQ